MTKRSDEIYNSNLQKSGNNANISSGAGCSGHHFNHQFSVLSQQHRRSDLITGGKLPIHGPRRFSKPAPISNSGFVPASNILLFLSLRLRIITSFVNWLHLSTNGLYSIYIFICSVFFLVAPNEACRPSLVKSFSMIFVFQILFFSEDALNIFGVRCTFWSLGDSLKPGGFVKSFVVSAFCFSLFQKPNGHPDSSKRHYFFPNIAVSSQTIF